MYWKNFKRQGKTPFHVVRTRQTNNSTKTKFEGNFYLGDFWVLTTLRPS